MQSEPWGVCSPAAFGSRHVLQLAASAATLPAMVGQIVGAVEQLQGMAFRTQTYSPRSSSIVVTVRKPS